MRLVLVVVLAMALTAPALAENPLPPGAATAAATADDFVPPGATNVFKRQDGSEISVVCQSTLDHSALVEFYRPVLERNGWRFIGDFRRGLSHSYGLAKGDKGQGLLLLSPKGDSTSVLFHLKE